jgi:hypothetical protein
MSQQANSATIIHNSAQEIFPQKIEGPNRANTKRLGRLYFFVTTQILKQTLKNIYNNAEIIHTHATQKKKLKT